MPKTMIIALGGNAILQPGQRGTVAEQTANIRTSCQQIAEIIRRGYRVVLIHGNGPQVGNLLLQNELARDRVPPMPLDILDAETQGEIGYLLQRELQGALQEQGPVCSVVSLVTQVVVDPQDPAFRSPSKPVGPFYTEVEARALQAAGGYPMVEDAGRGWRRVVPSPRPLRVVELAAIAQLVEGGTVVIACGGGGIPVVAEPEGLQGVEAVIDKDLAAQRLATDLGAHLLLILTDVPQVYLHYGQPGQQGLDTLTVAAARRYLAAGHFSAGSMRTKMEGAIQFVAAGGEAAIITSLGTAVAALEGRAGTRIVGTDAPGGAAAVAGPARPVHTHETCEP